MVKSILLVAPDKSEHASALRTHPEEHPPHQVIHTPTPALALETLRQRADIDVLVIDWKVRSVTAGGLELCQQARESQRPHHLYIILLADSEHRTETKTALQYGADAFIFKPIDVGEWLAHVQIARRIRVLEQELAEHLGSLNAIKQQLEETEREKKQFYRDILRAVTRDKLQFVEADEIPDLGAKTFESSVADVRALSALRRDLRERATTAGMTEDQTEHFAVACGEAMTNGIRHGRDASWQMWQDANTVTGRITDRGTGISPEVLPASVLRPGFSTGMSMGVGFELMLQLTDRMWLATGPSGTVIQLSIWINPPEPPRNQLLVELD